MEGFLGLLLIMILLKTKFRKIQILKSQILLPDGPLKNVGEYKIKFSPHSEVVVHFNIKVIPEVPDQ